MSIKTAAVIPASGIGDALLMMIVANNLYLKGYRVTLFHPQFVEMQSWFNNCSLKKEFSEKDIITFDWVIVENDNSCKVKELIEQHKKGIIKKLTVFYPSYKLSKHGKLNFFDVVFDANKNMVTNLAQASKSLGLTDSVNTGISFIDKHLIYKKYPKRVVIHPDSNDFKKNWDIKKYILLAKKLQKIGYDPVFVQKNINLNIPNSIAQMQTKTLNDLATMLYESVFFIGNDSGPGHMASLLQIPSIILAADKKNMILWQPGWHFSKIIFPNFCAINIKFLRIRRDYWQNFISVSKVLRTFIKELRKQTHLT